MSHTITKKITDDKKFMKAVKKMTGKEWKNLTRREKLASIMSYGKYGDW